jgi:hypothetical protein
VRINRFDQPNVAEAKAVTNGIVASGPRASAGFDDLPAQLGEVKPGDYVAIMPYLDRTPVTEETLKRARMALLDRLHVATTLGFGPRFLHSTGQFHKGRAETPACSCRSSTRRGMSTSRSPQSRQYVRDADRRAGAGDLR